MKNMRKLLAIGLFLLLLITSFATVSAEEKPFSGILSKTFKADENGDIEVLIDIAGNPGINSLSLEVEYDSEALTFKEDGFVDTGLLLKNIDTTLTLNPFRLSWNHSDGTAVNNYKNGTIAKLYFKANEDFYGATQIDVRIYSAQTIIDDEFKRPPYMDDGVITVVRDQIRIKDGVAYANNLNGETLIIASYDEDSMIDCVIYPNSTGDKEIIIEDVIDLTGATKVKAFLWKNLETCMPVCGSAEEIIILHQ